MKKLLELLQSKNKRRFEFTELRDFYLQCDPAKVKDSDLDLQVLEVLNQFKEQGWVVFPSEKNKTSWKGEIKGIGIPKFVTLPKRKQEKEKLIPESIAWLPELRPYVFGGKRITHPSALLRLFKINEFLKGYDSSQPLVPARERALEIFGDEKALDQNKPMIYEVEKHQLTLADLGAFYCPPPIPWQSPDQPRAQLNGKPILIVENSNTYHSFVRWNETSLKYAAIAYTKGNELAVNQVGLDKIVELYPFSSLCYFGDLDPAGLRILCKANEIRSSSTSISSASIPLLPMIQPDFWTYQLALDRDLYRKQKVDLSPQIQADIQTLFGSSPLAQAILSLFQRNQVIPQEAVGYSTLIQLFKSNRNEL